MEGRPASTCAGCGIIITDRYFLHAVDRQWHIACLKCFGCKAPLDTELSCFSKDGHIYCKEDYYRLFAVRHCSRCGRGIFASELVMRARDLVFHLHCFTCAWCNAALTQGDLFGLRDNLVYCRPHYEALEYPNANTDTGGVYRAGPTSGRKGRPRKKKGDPDMSPIDPTCNLHLTHLDGSSPPLQGSGQRTKRMRTSFKHHQLRTMKSYFNINQNPDAKDLKQLAQKTGLSKRVLQVWFQNARAKWRRNNMKGDSMSGMLTSDQSPNSNPLHQGGGHMSVHSPQSSYSEPSPCVASDGSTQVGPGPMDFDSNDQLTPLVHGINPGSMHNGEMHMTTFHEQFFKHEFDDM